MSVSKTQRMRNIALQQALGNKQLGPNTVLCRRCLQAEGRYDSYIGAHLCETCNLEAPPVPDVYVECNCYPNSASRCEGFRQMRRTCPTMGEHVLLSEVHAFNDWLKSIHAKVNGVYGDGRQVVIDLTPRIAAA